MWKLLTPPAYKAEQMITKQHKCKRPWENSVYCIPMK